MSNSPPSRHALDRLGGRRRYGKTGRTISRWLKMGKFPKADFVINKQPYWWESTLIKLERSSVTERSAAKTSSAT